MAFNFIVRNCPMCDAPLIYDERQRLYVCGSCGKMDHEEMRTLMEQRQQFINAAERGRPWFKNIFRGDR